MAGGKLAAAFSLAGFWLLAACGLKGPDPSTLELVREFHDRILTVDSACRASLELLGTDRRTEGRPRSRGPASGRFDLLRMKAGGLDAAFLLIPVRQVEPTAEGLGLAAARESVLSAVEALAGLANERSALVSLAVAPEDAYRAEKEGRRALFLGIENGCILGRDLSVLADLHAHGVRMLTLCGGRDNLICDAAAGRGAPDDRGLSEFGRLVVAECNRLGIIIDLANASEKSFFDVLAASRAPVIVSRGAARALCDRPENLTDAMARALAAKGGVIQVCLVPRLLVRQTARGAARRAARLSDALDHIDHLRRVAGAGSVGIGTDFDGEGGLPDCRDVSEIFNLTWEALRRGYAESDVESLWGGNIMRAFKEVERVAGRR
ncbi:MAG TPA: membrane dipeptidase [Candidatus Aminicenantes bacterium]|nr:membrane dipeptidase [Candidatus Aminicenantes bacterium]